MGDLTGLAAVVMLFAIPLTASRNFAGGGSDRVRNHLCADRAGGAGRLGGGFVRGDSVYFRAGILSGFDPGAARYAPFLGTGHS